MNNKSLFNGMILTSLLVITSCTSPGPKKSAPVKSPEMEARARELQDEISIGREVAAKLFGTYGDLNKRKKSLEYLNLLVQTLAIKAGRPEIVYRVGILDTEEINAFAAPGGFILVTKGLLNTVQNEHELAGVLAHEMGHINHRHLFKEVAPKREISAGETLSRFLSRGGANVSFAFGQAISQGLKTLLEEGLKPELEYEADQSGIEYSWATGYDPRHFRAFIERLAKNQKKDTQILLKTHPSFENRLKQMEGHLLALGQTAPITPNDNPVLQKRFSIVTSKNE